VSASIDREAKPEAAGNRHSLVWTVYAVQFFFGGWFLAHGLNHWLHFFPRPSGSSPISKELIDALNHSGIFPVVKAIEVVTGIMFLLNRFVPLAVIAAFPVALSIALLNLLANDDTFSRGVAVITMLFIGIIAIGHLDKFIPMLSNKTGDPGEQGFGAFFAKRGFVNHTQSISPHTHALCILAGIAAPIALTFYATSASGPRSAAHYADVNAQAMSTREVIDGFEKLGIDEHNPQGAVMKYFSADVIDHEPTVAGDRQSIIDYLNKKDWSSGVPKRTIKHIVVEGDLAVVHHHLVRKPGQRGIAAVDIFRVKDGKVVEHWDVLQPVPETDTNKHGMF
jgi:predicted SnoaL-like aldol condensation-catalyzing enzyme